MIIKLIIYLFIINNCKVLSQTCIVSNFDLENDNGLRNYALRHWSSSGAVAGAIRTIPPIILRVTHLHSNAWFDALAPYDDTAIGSIVRDIQRLPLSERTLYNKNIAIIYASYAIWNYWEPELRNDYWDPMLLCINGTIPDENIINQNGNNLNTPQDIGYYIGLKIIEYYTLPENDINSLGNNGGTRKYNLEYYFDYQTGFEPLNTAYKYDKKGYWQPDFVYNNENNIQSYTIQTFGFAQLGLSNTITIKNKNKYINNINIKPPYKSYNYKSIDYITQINQVLYESYYLNDYKKMASEWFNTKIPAFSNLISYTRNLNDFTMEQDIHLIYTVSVAHHDASIIVWNQKIKYNAVRPFSVIKELYNNINIDAWGGVGNGPVNDILGNEWKPYLNNPDHPEYPSGSSCLCHAQAQVHRLTVNTDYTDNINNNGENGYSPRSFSIGSSNVEPGITPNTSFALGPYYTYTEWANECANSRVWAGIHFEDALIAGKQLCEPIGTLAYDYVNNLLNGIDPFENQSSDSSQYGDSSDSSQYGDSSESSSSS